MASPIINRVKTHTRNFESYFKFSRNLENKICTFVETRYFYFSNYLKNDREFLFSLRLEEKRNLNTVASVGPSAEKVNAVSNDHGRTQSATFLFLTGNSLFGRISEKKQKNQNCQFKLKFEYAWIWKSEYADFNGDAHFFRFWLELPLLDKFGPKDENCQFKGTLMQIWKSPYMFLFIWKQYPQSFALLILRIAREVCKFPKR